ncbi:MAG TPA: erythromycin esterase family protein, partial [Thermoanaerobaculia bacterium]|nr:erythromycin esterase family protein [Thermoanaerobaculia bacterium]
MRLIGRRNSAVAAAALILAGATLHAQDADPRVAWLAGHAVRIRTIDPADGELTDLEPLRASLAGVRVVLLGEQTHGDGTAFLAKTRLIRFLHEEMGFDVLAFESGLYDCAKAWELLTRGEAAREAVPRGVFRIWTASRELQPLIDYLGSRAATGRPLELAGADMQFSGTASGDFLLADLAAFLAGVDPALVEGNEWNRVAQVVNNLAESAWELGLEPLPPDSEQAAFARTIERWRSAIAACDASPATQPWSGSFWRQFLTSLRVFAEQTWRSDPEDHTSDVAVFAMRDLQMGKNLVWLAKERYPNRKIIVWAATFHNARNLGTIETQNARYARLYPGVAPMGEVAWKELGDELYSLGFLAFEGEAAAAFARNARPIPRPSAGSLEDLFARAGLETAFVDFRRPPAGGQWLRAPIAASPLG